MATTELKKLLGGILKEEMDEDSDEFFDLIVNFLIDLPEESIPDELAESYAIIMETLNAHGDEDENEEDEEDEEYEESTKENEEVINEIKTVRIKPADKRKYKMAYKKNKARLKMKMKKYRKSAKFKKYAIKAKRMAKMGKTSTGAKKVHYK